MAVWEWEGICWFTQYLLKVISNQYQMVGKNITEGRGLKEKKKRNLS
jgi:hypothetical protein